MVLQTCGPVVSSNLFVPLHSVFAYGFFIPCYFVCLTIVECNVYDLSTGKEPKAIQTWDNKVYLEYLKIALITALQIPGGSESV